MAEVLSLWEQVPVYGTLIGQSIRRADESLSRLCPSPLVLVGGTALAFHLVYTVRDRISPTHGLQGSLKSLLFSFIRSLPPIQRRIASEVAKAELSLEADVAKMYLSDSPCITQLPPTGLSSASVLSLTAEYMSLGPFNWESGQCSGAVYGGSPTLSALLKEVYGQSMWSNALHMNVFPGVCRMEAEVVAMAGAFFHAAVPAGLLTSGGTESLFMTLKVYRDWGRQKRGITRPSLVLPATAHPAFDKAAHLLKVRVIKVPVNPHTFQVDPKDVARAVTTSTVLIVVSAPTYPHGVVDPIPEVAEIGRRRGVGVHVDACLGGLLLPFLEDAGFPLPHLFDFRLPGVTSISADTHKYGNAPKGSSVLLFHSEELRRFCYFVGTDWPGGLYASPALAGSRSGANIAVTWASLVHTGRDGYVQNTREIMETARFILKATRSLEGIQVMGDPKTSVIAWASSVFDIYRLQAAMKEKEWQMSALQFPPGIHFCVALCNTREGVKERFVRDFKDCVSEIMKSPGAPTTGSAAIYGTTQQIPDRSIVSDIAASFLDKLYLTRFNNSTNIN